MSYFDELRRAMKLLGERGAVFIGQSVADGGTSMAGSWDDVPDKQRVEFPVAEDLQMGVCVGLAIGSFGSVLPVCVFPRWNFMICATNQIVNHLDRLQDYSGFRPKVIIRVATPSNKPFYAGPQHDDDFSTAFSIMLRNVKIVKLKDEAMIVEEYLKAADADYSTILVEYTERYRDERAKVQPSA